MALKIVDEIGFTVTKEDYRNMLKYIQDHDQKQIKP